MVGRGVGRQRMFLWVATACVAAAVSLVALSLGEREELSADVLLQGGLAHNGARASMQMLDQVTKMVGYSPSGISFSEGQMPLGLGAASGRRAQPTVAVPAPCLV